MLKSHYLYFLKHNISARLFGKKKPLLASFKVTYRCTLKCRSCPFWKMESRDIQFQKALEVMDYLYEQGIRLIIFEGGEPFVWRDQDCQLEDLVKQAKQKFFSVGITTNGTLPLSSSADILWVSFDGLKETHEKNRGPCFDKIIRNIEQSAHPKILANITINKLNVTEIHQLVRFLSDKVKGITIQFYYPFPNTEDLALTKDQRIRVLDELIQLKQQGLPILDANDTLQNLKKNDWTCHDWLIASAEPDGSVHIGCYLKNRADVSCEKCGFAAHAEVSKAYDWNWQSILVGKKTFDFRVI